MTATTPEHWEFVQPLADEPIPQTDPPGGATDAGLGGVDVTDEYLDADGNPRIDDAALAALLETWAAVYAKAHSYLGTYPPGRVRENVNTFTKAFYGNATPAAWCLIFVWYVLSSFGKLAWKLAYVPWINRIAGFRSGQSGIKPGAICAIARFSHVGFYVTGNGSTFDLLSGNSRSGASSDAITIKRYPVSVISGHVNLDYATTPPPTPPPAVVEDDLDEWVA